MSKRPTILEILAPFTAEVHPVIWEAYATSKKRYLRDIDEGLADTSGELFAQLLGYFTTVVVPHKIAVYKRGVQLYDALPDTLKGKLPMGGYVLEALVGHDMSKFTTREAVAYARHDFKSPQPDPDFDRAWAAHFSCNTHHPEHWIIPRKTGDVKYLEMPKHSLFHMVADWMGAGDSYGNPLPKWLKAQEEHNGHYWEWVHPESQEYLKDLVEVALALYPAEEVKEEPKKSSPTRVINVIELIGGVYKKCASFVLRDPDDPEMVKRSEEYFKTLCREIMEEHDPELTSEDEEFIQEALDDGIMVFGDYDVLWSWSEHVED